MMWIKKQMINDMSAEQFYEYFVIFVTLTINLQAGVLIKLRNIFKLSYHLNELHKMQEFLKVIHSESIMSL